MKTNITKLFFAFVFIAVSIVSVNSVHAQEDAGFTLSMTEFTIKPGHNNQFREGVKAWKACYLENEGEWNWNMWSRINGEGNVYILASAMGSWSEMDESDPASMPCRDIGRDLINPHVESAKRNFTRFMPDISKSYPNTDSVLWVSYFHVNHWTNFREMITEVSDEMTKAEGSPRGFWYSFIGGSADEADYMVATPYANFTALDVERDNVWEIYEKAHGEKKTEEMRDTFVELVNTSWAYLYRLSVDLSNMPPPSK